MAFAESETKVLKRVVTAVALGSYTIAMVLLGRYVILANLLILMLIGLYEIIYVLRLGGFHPVAWIHYVLVLAYIPAYLWGEEKGVLLVMFLGLAVCMAIASLTREVGTTDMLATLLPSFYPAYPFIAFVMLVVSSAPHWRLMIWLLLITSVISDICALFVGTTLGRHKLIPKVSPKKTVEGAIGGFIGSVVAALCVYAYCSYAGEGIPLVHFLILGVIGGVATQVGDLIASYIKRFCGVKDYGTIFPGHGGVLDRVDGILINAIAFCAYATFFLI